VGSEHLIVSKPQLGTKINNYMECAIIFADVETTHAQLAAKNRARRKLLIFINRRKPREDEG